MEIEDDGHGKIVIKTNNIAEILDFLKANDKREIEDLRPVLVITMDDPVGNDGYQRPRVNFGQALAASIELSGYSAGNACFDDKSATLCTFDFPTAHKWTDAIRITEPLLAPPSFGFKQLDTSANYSQTQKKIAGWDSDEKNERISILRTRIKALVLASHELTDQYIAKVLQPWDGIAEQDLPLLIHHGPEGGSIVALERIRVARERFTAELRFLFNHAKLFCDVTERALFKILLDADVDRMEAEKSIPYLTQYTWTWAHPLFLQVLHFLKDSGRVGTHDHRRHLSKTATPFSFAHLYAEGLPIFERTKDGFDLVWRGTGAFKEWRQALGRAPRPEEQEPTAFSSHFTHFVFNVFQHVHSTGLLGLDDDRIVLSPWGLDFINLLGPETKDPDVLLRWRRDLEIGSSNDIDHMDAWLYTTFTAAKKSINKHIIEEENYVFDDPDFFAADLTSSNRLSIFGFHIQISSSDMNDSTFADEIAEIAASERRIPASERCIGLIYDRPKMKTDSKLSGLWIGVPLAVNSDGALSNEPGWLRDTSRTHDEAMEVVRTTSPEIKRRIVGQEPRLIHNLPTKEPIRELRSLPWKLAPTDADNLRPIIFGVASTINLQSEIPAGLRRYLQHTEKTAIPNYYDGICQFRGIGTELVTTTCGFFVGIYDESNGTWFIEREVNPDRLEAFSFKKRHMLGNLKAHFAIDRKNDGYWTVLKDGTTKQLFPRLDS
jgi:hypothetical protein